MDGLSGTLARLAAMAGLVVLNGFFVAAEFALVSVRKTRIEELVKQGSKSARRVQEAIRDLDRYIAGTQVGITIASLALGWIGEPALVHLIEPVVAWLPVNLARGVSHAVAVAIAFGAITFLHVVVGELVPKSVALQIPEQVALWVGFPMRLAVLLFQPLIWGLNGFGNAILRTLGFQPAAEHHGVHSVDELEILVRQSHAAGVLDDREREMLQRTFRFGELTAGEVMIPRTDMVAINVDVPTEEALRQIGNSVHSRIPIYERSMDQMLGIVLVQELFRKVLEDRAQVALRSLIRPALFVPNSMTLDQLLEVFRRERAQLAIVIDEYGGTAGLITLEDVVEEIFGDLQDTLEGEQPDIQRQPDGRIVARGDVALEDLRDETGWDLVDEEVETIAGYVMKRLGRVARLNDQVQTPFGDVQVINMSRVRITFVALVPKPPTADEPALAAAKDGG